MMDFGDLERLESPHRASRGAIAAAARHGSWRGAKRWLLLACRGHWACDGRPCSGRVLRFDDVDGNPTFSGDAGAGVRLGEGARWTVTERRLDVVSAGGRHFSWVIVRLADDELVLLDEYESALLTFRRVAP
jgi:hypothetical protein